MVNNSTNIDNHLSPQSNTKKTTTYGIGMFAYAYVWTILKIFWVIGVNFSLVVAISVFDD